MNLKDFVQKWRSNTATENAASQEHFIDLCHVLGVETPNDVGDSNRYAFEKGATKANGSDGWADVWKRDHFAWEYKGKGRDLGAAYRQLLGYFDALDHPPLLVVCDMNRFEIHTMWTGLPDATRRFTLDDIANDPAEYRRVLLAVLQNPAALKPTATREEITQGAAADFAGLARRLRDRGHEPLAVAHFLIRLLFCLFAEDEAIDLLPRGIIGRLAETTRTKPKQFAAGLADLFQKMAKSGGLFGSDPIRWFNGRLFDDATVLPLEPDEIALVREASTRDWSNVEAAIFGTLFERGLDPDKRTQLGAHYTDRSSIEHIVEPVVIRPLRKEFEAAKASIRATLANAVAGGARAKTAARRKATAALEAFVERLRSVRVLDPACGSGNFLYVTLLGLKDLEFEAIEWESRVLGITTRIPGVGPGNVCGIEVNEYAAELARVTIWIGEIQWMRRRGFGFPSEPILKTLDHIQCRDAILDLSDPAHPAEPRWPAAYAIVGNPPFLGGKMLRTNLGNAYVEAMFKVYEGRVPAEADLVVYWHEKARAMVEAGTVERVGLLATQGIRGGANRRVLERVKATGDLFLAWSDVPWILDGATVHVSLVGFDRGVETERVLDGKVVATINADLSSGLDLTKARRLRENLGISFMGDTKGGAFDIPEETARAMLEAANPGGASNADVLRPWANGRDLTQRTRGQWIIDCGCDRSAAEAALYEAPFEYLRRHVKPTRATNRRAAYAEKWWIHAEPRPAMRAKLAGLTRYLATPNLTKHRIFVFLPREVLPDHQLIVFAREDDFFFGVLQSSIHERWARATGSQLRDAESGFRYTPSTTFETFPFPKATRAQAAAISAAAKQLDTLRQGWLNPPGATTEALRSRTLTNLYNARPQWLLDAHRNLDAAVLAAYGWPPDLDSDGVLARLLALNQQREAALGAEVNTTLFSEGDEEPEVPQAAKATAPKHKGPKSKPRGK